MKRTRILSVFLSVCMIIMCMVGMSVSASADTSLSDCEVWVDVYEQTVTVELNGETVPESEYHVIFFSYTPIEGGESLERVGTDFPTAPGTYIAAIVANEGSDYSGENRSEPFTIEAAEAAEETNPATDAELPGLAVLAISAAAVMCTVKKRNK